MPTRCSLTYATLSGRHVPSLAAVLPARLEKRHPHIDADFKTATYGDAAPRKRQQLLRRSPDWIVVFPEHGAGDVRAFGRINRIVPEKGGSRAFSSVLVLSGCRACAQWSGFPTLDASSDRRRHCRDPAAGLNEIVRRLRTRDTRH
jgi:hypothetical protein